MSTAVKSVITCDLEGRIETFNEGAEQLFGWQAPEVIGKKRVSLFSPGPVVLEHVPRWLKTSVEEGKFETDTVFRTKDGREFPAHIRLSPTFKGGKQIGYCGVTEALPDSELERARPTISWATRLFIGLVVTRAPFLTATLVPVLLGAALAAQAGKFHGGLFALALVGALALHVAANTWNDLFDWKSGTDQANNDYFLPYSGGSRSLELGLITERGLSMVAWGAALVAIACGAALAVLGTPWVLAVGAAGGVLGFCYTAPPLRLAARRGLGELAVTLAFGPLLVLGVVTAITGVVDVVPALAGLPLGFLTANILLINEIPDAKSDAATGKNHLVVTFGARGARVLYVVLLLAAVASHVALVVAGLVPVLSLIALVALPLGVRAVLALAKNLEDRALVAGNKATINLQLAYGLLLTIGTWLG